MPADKQLSAKVLTQAVDQALAQLAHRPKVHILDSVRDLFRREEPGATMGVVFKNEIYLFRDAIDNLDTANDTLWHGPASIKCRAC
ncbi:MAG: hypothetical protein JSR83_15860 [Proteobacteria bacterium]|nr:hypothetical protein [Pseudomonadota bacterium]